MFTVLDSLFLFFTFLGNYSIVWICIALVLAWQQKKNSVKMLGLVGAAIISSFIITEALKIALRVQRPMLHSSFCPTDFSFPSGHAATSFAAALILMRFDYKRRWTYASLACLISYSRIFLNCHRLTDILAGILLGSTVSLLLLRMFTKKMSPLAKKL